MHEKIWSDFYHPCCYLSLNETYLLWDLYLLLYIIHVNLLPLESPNDNLLFLKSPHFSKVHLSTLLFRSREFMRKGSLGVTFFFCPSICKDRSVKKETNQNRSNIAVFYWLQWWLISKNDPLTLIFEWLVWNHIF